MSKRIINDFYQFNLYVFHLFFLCFSYVCPMLFQWFSHVFQCNYCSFPLYFLMFSNTVITVSPCIITSFPTHFLHRALCNQYRYIDEWLQDRWCYRYSFLNFISHIYLNALCAVLKIRFHSFENKFHSFENKISQFWR